MAMIMSMTESLLKRLVFPKATALAWMHVLLHLVFSGRAILPDRLTGRRDVEFLRGRGLHVHDEVDLTSEAEIQCITVSL